MAKSKKQLSPEERRLIRVEAARKGGLTTKRRMLAKNPYYYEEIGLKGGQTLLRERGREHFRRAVAIREAKKREARS